MNLSNSLITAVRSGLFTSLRDIRQDVYKNNIKFSPSESLMAPSIPPSTENSKIISNIKHDIQRLHLINGLKNDEQYLKNSLFSLTQNENLLKNESFTSLNIHSNSNSFTIDKTLLKVKLSHISEVKDKVNKRLSEVSTQIDKLIYQESRNTGSTKTCTQEKLQHFLDNFELDKINYNKKLNELHKESEIRKQKMLNEISNKLNERSKELLIQERLNDLKKMEMIQQKRIEEKTRIKERTKVNNEKLLKLKPYINNKNRNTKYSYIDNILQYEQNKEQAQHEENVKRKAKMQHIDINEFKDFQKKIIAAKYKAEEESLNKAKMLKEMWSERNKLIPSYTPQIYLKIEEDMNNKQIEVNKKTEKAKLNRSLKVEYSKKKVPRPKVKDSNKDNSNEQKLPMLKKSMSSENITLKLKHQQYYNPIREVKKYYPKESNSNSKSNYNDNIYQSFEYGSDSEMKGENMKQFVIDRIKKLKPKITTTSNKKVEPLNKPIDYLTEERIKKENIKKNNSTSLNTIAEYNENEKSPTQKEISKIFNDNKGGTVDESIHIAKNKVLVLEEQAKQKEQLLKVSGGVIENPDLGNEVCDLMIDSIKAKLSIIGQFNMKINNEEVV